MSRSTTALVLLASAAACVAGTACSRPDSAAAGERSRAELAAPADVAALGRLEPENGILRIAGPSRPSAVIAELLVEEGDRVAEGQPIAILDSRAESLAQVTRMKSQLAHARRELERRRELYEQKIVSTQALEDAQLAVETARADLETAQAALDRDTVVAPATGEVIAIHARRGERVPPDGLAELAQNDRMYVVAQVYETDVGRVRVGQRATASSPALAAPLEGVVDRIGRKVGKLDLLDTDPIARTDARVVDVHVKLDDSERAAGLSNLQVEVSIQADIAQVDERAARAALR
jgi:HlyD family secretion protein